MAKIPTILEAGRADGKLVTSDAIFDENKEMFQSEINDIQDTLNSDNPNKPLSAKQGKILKDLLDSKVIEAGSVPIDTEPIEGNITHLVNSDGLAKEFKKHNTAITKGSVYDVSFYNKGAVFDSIQSLLSSSDLNTLIPTSVRHGGMSIRFIQGSVPTSDNKYVQYRLMAQSFTTDTTQWAICDDEVLVEAPAYIKAETDANGHLLFWILSDGSIDWAIGVPTPVKFYVDSFIEEILNGNEDTNIDGLNKVIEFLDDFSTSDTLASLLNTKVDKEDGKGLIQDEVAERLSVVEEPEFMDVELDSEGRVLSGRKTNGNKFENMPIETPSVLVSNSNADYSNDNYIEVKIDKDNKIFSSRKKDGTLIEQAIEAKSVDSNYINTKEANIENINQLVNNVVVLPDYYNQENYIDNIVLNIQKSILQIGRGSIFGFITDTHPMDKYSVNSGKIYKYIASRTPLQKIFFGGDIGPSDATCYGYGTSALDGLAKSIIQQTERLYAPCREAGCSIYIARGNHDFASSKDKGATTFDENGFIATREATRHMVFAYAENIVNDLNNPKSNYYYFDNKAEKIRYVFLDTSDSVDSYGGGSGSNVTIGVSDTQIKWIAEEAVLTTPEDYKLIFVGHVCPSAVGYAYLGGTPPYERRSIHNINVLIEAIQKNSVAEIMLENETTVEYDFTAFEPKVLIYLAGHQHFDSQTYENNCLYYVSSADWVTQEHASSRVERQLFNINIPARAEKSIMEDLLNVILVDITNDKIRLFRVGPGLDKVFNLTQVSVVVNRTVTLTSELRGSLVWKSYDALKLKDGATNNDLFSHTVASVDESTGIVTSLTTGESVVVAYSESENKMEFFDINVI